VGLSPYRSRSFDRSELPDGKYFPRPSRDPAPRDGHPCRGTRPAGPTSARSGVSLRRQPRRRGRTRLPTTASKGRRQTVRQTARQAARNLRPLRPERRARQLRLRPDRAARRSTQPRHRRTRAHRAGADDPSRRHRRRRLERRRLRPVAETTGRLPARAGGRGEDRARPALRLGSGVLAARRRDRNADQENVFRRTARAWARRFRLAAGAGERCGVRRAGEAHAAEDRTAVRGAGAGRRRRTDEQRAIRARAVCGPAPRDAASGRPAGALRRQPQRRQHRLQGHGAAAVSACAIPRPAAPRTGEQRGGVPSAFLHQHQPALAAGAAVPPAGAQRRDQHHIRQPPVGARARPCVAQRGSESRRIRSADRDGRLGFAKPRFDAGTAAGRRHGFAESVAHPDSARNAVAGIQGRRPTGVLRVLRDQQRTLGRPRRHRRLRRPLRRLHHRPQRPAPGALAVERHPRVHGRLRSRRVGRRADRDPGQGQARSRADDRRRSRQRSIARQRCDRRDQPRPRAVQAMAEAGPDLSAHRTGRPEPDRDPVRCEHAGRFPETFPAHARRTRTDPAPAGRDRTGSGRIDGRRRADGGALRSSAAALRPLPSGVRAGDQSADRFAARGLRDVAGDADRRRRQSVRRRPGTSAPRDAQFAGAVAA
jgi:hypothetical protein